MNTRELADYVMEQLDELEDVRRIPMMGGWLFYYKDRIFGGIYNGGRLMIKITDASRKYMPEAEPEEPYAGAKPMFPALIADDKENFRKMVEEMWRELPAPKKKTPKRKSPAII